MSLGHAEYGLTIPSNVGLREEVLGGGFGATAIVNAKDILIFILNKRMSDISALSFLTVRPTTGGTEIR